MIQKTQEKIYNLSKKYGDKIGLDLPYFVKNSFWVILRQVVGTLSGLVLSVAFARLATQEVFGQYQFILSILSIVSILSIPGLNTSITRSVARGFDGDYKNVVKTSFFWSLLGVPALLIIGGYYYFYQNQTLGIALMIVSIFFPFFYAPNTWDYFLQGKSRFDVSTKYSSIQAIINTLATMAVIFFCRNNLFAIIITYLVSFTFFNGYYYWKSLKYIKNDKKDDNVVKYGWFLTKMNIIVIFASNVDSILLAHFAGFEKLAVYAIVLQMASNIKNLSKGFYKMILPKVANLKNPLSILASKKRIGCIFLVSLFFAIFLIVAAPFLIEFLFSAKYEDSIFLFQILILAFPIWIINSLFISVGEAKKDTRFIFLVNFVPYVMLILATIAFIFYQNLLVLIFGHLTFSLSITIISIIFLIKSKFKNEKVSQI